MAETTDKNIYDAFLQIRGKCEKLRSHAKEQQNSDFSYIDKALMLCRDVLQHKQEVGPRANQDTKLLLRKYAQVVLDYTFYIENKLVEEDFPETRARQTILEIFDELRAIEELTQSNFSGCEVSEILGPELFQCLQWRRGALIYMYCKTVMEDDGRQKDRQLFVMMVDGVRYLEKTLPIEPTANTTGTESKGSLDLFHMGIHNDTELLGLMYAGEMSYWLAHYSEHLRPSQDPSSGTPLELTSEEARQKCVEFLCRYVKAVEGPLENLGWDCRVARKILGEVESRT